MDPVPAALLGNASTDISTDGIASLLAVARQRINEGNPSLALQAVVIALRASGGEKAVLQALKRAQEMYHTRRQSSEAVDELSALFAECALATENASNNVAKSPETLAGTPSNASGAQEMDMMEQGPVQLSAPILAESGRLQVVMDASADGSSFVCGQCGGVVSNQRRDEHFNLWCPRASQ